MTAETASGAAEFVELAIIGRITRTPRRSNRSGTRRVIALRTGRPMAFANFAVTIKRATAEFGTDRLEVRCQGIEAEHMLATLHAGDFVTVAGRLVERHYTNAAGEEHVEPLLFAEEIALSVRQLGPGDEDEP